MWIYILFRISCVLIHIDIKPRLNMNVIAIGGEISLQSKCTSQTICRVDVSNDEGTNDGGVGLKLIDFTATFTLYLIH